MILVRCTAVACIALLSAAAAPSRSAAAITIDYPEDGSIFPPEITPPTFLWRDGAKGAVRWRIEVSFADGSPALRVVSRGPRMRTGTIDPDCVSETNRLPSLTPDQAAARTWAPDTATWEAIKKRSVAAPAIVTITGLAAGGGAVSRGRVTLRTSRDPVGAPIFYRDVPLMPSETEKGVIKPLASYAQRLIAWRIRNLADPDSRVVMENMPMCANCHSFSADGKTLGMDLDGLQNNKGLYTLTPVARETSVGMENVIQWATAAGKLNGPLRVGFLSQVSPDGRYVVTTIDSGETEQKVHELPSNYYVANFKDYRFLQVFYPTRGILSWYSRETGILQPLPGADDRRFVQTNAVWSPDGSYLVFARAEARAPYPEGVPMAKFVNDPNETQIRYDLYRIPFRGGKGGAVEPLRGASQNGMSNTFPKVSPDGRWIVFVQARNGLLMRPDSALYIVPAEGGAARRMRCNTKLMNSWHSFSPNGRWLVFSSKSRSPYTQMYLTHIDENGNDSPATLIDNATAANRAVNLPEFVNIAPDGMRSLGGPALDYYRIFDRALYLQKQARYEESAAEWRRVLEINRDDALAHSYLGMTLLLAGRRQGAAPHIRKAAELKLRAAVEANPGSAEARDGLGAALLDAGRTGEAIVEFRKALDLNPRSARASAHLGQALAARGHFDEALVRLRAAVEFDGKYAPAHYQLGLVLARRGGRAEAIESWRKALALDPEYAEAHESLADALYTAGESKDAVSHWREVLRLRPNRVEALRRIAWALATCPDASVRNGAEAVKLATRAVQLSGGKNASVLDTLAAAYAETGRFADAVFVARRALEVAPPAEKPLIESRLARYRAQPRGAGK